MTTDQQPATEDADRRIVRRAQRAGIAVFAVLSVLTVAANAAFGGDGTAAAVWVASCAVVGTLVSCGWLVLALLLDLFAGQMPGRRRIIWTAAMFAAAFVAPILPAVLLQMAAGA
ncbi:hypothetical protein BH23ACT9_BH23ACT9_13470 [soil metagenome]